MLKICGVCLVQFKGKATARCCSARCRQRKRRGTPAETWRRKAGENVPNRHAAALYGAR